MEPANLTRRYYQGILRLRFDDAGEETKGLEPGSLPDLLPDHAAGRRLIVHGDELCDYNDARKIFQFLMHAASLREEFELMVHCEAGISRSAAVALFAADRFGGSVVNTNRDTGGANRRLMRLLKKVADGDAPVIKDLPEDILSLRKMRTQSKLGLF